jgi:hypothetical protein
VATEVVTTLRDDLDGSTAERTVGFSWDGASYEIDLSKKNIAELTAALAPYVAAGRTVSVGRRAARGRVARSGASAGPRAGVDLAAVRVWAAANGHAVAARGRISATVLDAFQSASGGSTKPAAKAAGRPAKRTPGRKRATRA